MDWYYPVLSGALTGAVARTRLSERWAEFTMDRLGVRCVSDQPWVTAAEPAECAMALDAAGMAAEAWSLLDWVQHLRCEDGSYWTGCVYPQAVPFPGGERSTYTAAYRPRRQRAGGPWPGGRVVPRRGPPLPPRSRRGARRGRR